METLRKLLQEAGRRHVARVAVVYAAVAFAVLEATDIVIPALEWPEWVIRWVIGLALLGFPTTLIFAWVFDFTPKGVIRTKALEEEVLEEGYRPEGPRPFVSAVLLLFSGALVAMGAFFTFQWSRTDEATPAGLMGAGALTMSPQRIAVLPFVDLDGAEDGGFFANGIHEDILNHLAQVDSMEVISRTTMLQYRNTEKSAQGIGRELNAGSILEGSVRRQGDSVRVVAQLIDARNDTHLWSETYDEPVTDVFRVQSEIAQNIAAALEVELTTEEMEQLAAPAVVSGDAYDLYNRGRAQWDLRETRGNAREAVRLFQQATEVAPTFAMAFAALSQAHMWIFSNFPGAQDQAERGTEALDRAVALAPSAVETFLAQGYFHFYGSGDMDRALAHFNQALELRPRDAEVLTAIGMIHRAQGRWDQAIAAFEQAQRTDARSYNLIYTLGETNLRMRRWDEAERWLSTAANLASDAINPHLDILRLHMAQTGDLASAQTYVDELPTAVPGPIRTMLESELAYYRGDFRAALEPLEARLLNRGGPGPERPRDEAQQDVPAGPTQTPPALEQRPGEGTDVQTGTGERVGAPDPRPSMAPLYERIALLYHLLGDEESSQAYADSLRAGSQSILDEIDANPGPFHTGVKAAALAKLGVANALLGEPIRAARNSFEACSTLSTDNDAYGGGNHARDLVVTYLLIGATELAFPEVQKLLMGPSPITRVELELDPLFEPLRAHPDFETLLASAQ